LHSHDLSSYNEGAIPDNALRQKGNLPVGDAIIDYGRGSAKTIVVISEWLDFMNRFLSPPCLLLGLLLTVATGDFSIAQTENQPELSQAPSSTASPKPKYGDATAETAIRSFYTALAMADRDTVEYLLVTPNELQDWIDAQLEITYAFHRFSEAAKATFGDEGKSLYMPSPFLISLNQLKDNKPKETGDRAEWKTHPRLPTKLLRTDGHWKLDLLRSFEKPDHVLVVAKEMQKTAALVDALAEEMEKGKFESVQQVRAELKRRREASQSNKR
jgi:hypothetical protein